MSAKYFRQISHIALMAALGVHLGAASSDAQQHALPQGPSVVSGGVTVGSSSGSGLIVTQSTPRAIVNWNSFSLGQPNSVTFQQPGSSSAILNRVTGKTASTIAGKISANGQVFLVNPNGIAITPTGTVDVGGGFVGSSLDIRDQDFMGGVLNFFGTGSSAGVGNAGSIQAGTGGFVGLLGGNVSNSGTISVPLGRVGLGAGERATLDLTGDGFLQVAVPSGTVSDRALVDSSGRIRAPGGRVELKAATVRSAIRNAVNVSGVVAANSVSGVDGAIVLGGGDGGNINVTGTLDASGAAKAGAVDIGGGSVKVDGGAKISASSETGKGGAVTITASDKVTIGKAKIDASGAIGGGHVRIGGDLQGGGTLTRAQDVVIGADAEIRADATETGTGGTVIVWSDSLTSFEGRISARGGTRGGDGGFAEVSGKQTLDYRGVADLTSYKGRFGTLLLDPYDMTIWSGASSGVSGLAPTANDSLLNVTTLRDQLQLANVTLTTGASGSQAGNITVLAPLSWTANTVLTLTAANSIFVHAPIVATGASAGFAVNYGASGQFMVSPGASVSLPGANSTFSANGDSYTMIRTLADLQAMQNGLAGKYAVAVAIDATDTVTWNVGGGFMPIGNSFSAFSGRLQGLGNAISNLTINRPSEVSVGLFGVAYGATISNVAMTDANIVGQRNVGGLVGSYFASTIQSSYVTGHVTGGANTYVDTYVGGLVGQLDSGTISDSYASATVSGARIIGGLVGHNRGTITRSYGTGAVTATDIIAGGLVGSNYGTVSYSYATGAARATTMMAGGLVGDNTSARIEYSYATGAVTGGYSAGGLVGYMNKGVVLGSYSSGFVTGDGSMGGLVGDSMNDSHVTESYWDTQTSGLSRGVSNVSGTFVATGLTTAQATSQASYTDFDFASIWAGFDGTRPLLRHEYSVGVSNANQLQLMGLNLSGRYVLTRDIDASGTAVTSSVWGTRGFSPVAVGTSNFTGTFDGAGFKISGLTINRASQTDVGLFGRVSGSSARISNVSLVGGSIKGGTNTGALVGLLSSSAIVSSSYASSAVAGTTSTGGLVGNLSSGASVQSSYATGTVTATGSGAGGLVGSATGTISGSYATGTVTGTSSMGGLVGSASSSTISDSYATGNVTGTGNSVGGLIGGATQSTVASSYASGTVKGVENIGGLIGYVGFGSTVSKSYAMGAVSGTTSVGGLVGALLETNFTPRSSVTDSYATGNVTATGSRVGGLVGYSNYYTTVTKSYATGNVSGQTNVGGLVGESWQYTTVSNSYATGTVTGTTSVGGLVGLLQQSSTALNSYATGAVTGSSRVGGLIGSNSGSTVRSTYATGTASGPEAVGGLIGYLYQGSVYSSYARGNATGTGGNSNLVGGLVGVSHSSHLEANYSTGVAQGTTNVGGLIGLNNGSGLYANYWDTQTSGRATAGSGSSSGATGRTTAQMQDIANFAANYAGWDFSGTWIPPNQAGQGGDTTAHYPELYALTRAIAVKTDDKSMTYSGTRPVLSAAEYSAYGGYNAATGVTAYGLGAAETIDGSDISFTLADPNALLKSTSGHDNAGAYGIAANSAANPSIDGSGGTAYRFVVVPGTLTVDQKALTVTATANNKVYDATTAGSASFADNRLSGDVLTVSSTGTVFAGVNVGTGIATTTSGITISGADAANYSINTTATSSADITARSITVSASSNQTKIYGNADPVLVYAISSGMLAGSDTFSGLLSRTAGENVGNYAIGQGSLTLGSNYVLSFTPGTTFAVSPRSITVTANAGPTKVYGNADPAFGYTIGGMGLAFSDTLSGAMARASGENVGSYSINQGTLAASSNYTLIFNGNDFSITQRPLTVAPLTGQSKIYGNSDPSFNFQISSGSLVGSDAFTGALERASGENVGNYAINQGTLTLGGNYALSFVAGTTFAITQRPITVAANAGQTKIYGNSDPTFSYQISSGALVGSDAFSGALTRAAGENVGSYAIGQGSLTLSSNYALSFVSGTTFAITQRPITVAANAGQTKIYGNADPAFGYQITSGSLVGIDTFSGAISRSAGENVGAYAIDQGSLTLGGNYALSFTPGTTFAVTPRAISVTADAGQTKVYGNTDPTFSYTIGGMGLAFSDTLSGALARAPGENVGTYAINQGTMSASGNYTLSFNGNDFSITQRSLTVAPLTGQSKIYGNSDPSFNFQISSGALVGSDAFTGALERASGENVGNYAINQGTLTLSGNYALSFVAGATFAVTQRPITVAANAGQTKVYGNSDPTFGYQITSGTLVGSDAFSGALGRVAGENVGTYTVALGSLTLGGNYALSVVPGTMLAITPRAITVSANAGQSKVYGNAEAALTYQISSGSLVGSDAFSGALTRAAGENVGTYAIGQGSLTLGGNYALSFTPGATFDITTRALTVTALDVSRVYDGLAFQGGNGVSYAGFANGDTAAVLGGTLVYGGTAQGALDAGRYDITVSGLSSGNYAINYRPGTLVIEPQPSAGPRLSSITPQTFVGGGPMDDWWSSDMISRHFPNEFNNQDDAAADDEPEGNSP